MPNHKDAAEMLDLLQRWDHAPTDSPELVIALLDQLLSPPLGVHDYYALPAAESSELNAPTAKDYAAVRSQSAMVIGAFTQILAKVRAVARTTEGQARLEAWAAAVIAEPREAARQIPAELRSLLVLYLLPETAWGQPDIRARLTSTLRFHSHLVDGLLQDHQRPLSQRTDLLVVMAGRSDAEHLGFLQALASPARTELLAYGPFRRFLWKRLLRTVEGGTFQHGAQLAIFNVLLETADDRELAPLIGSALASDPQVNSPAAASWGRLLVGLEAAGRLEGLLPAGQSFPAAYVARFLHHRDAAVPRGWDHGASRNVGPDELAVELAALRAGRQERVAALPNVRPTPRVRG